MDARRASAARAGQARLGRPYPTSERAVGEQHSQQLVALAAGPWAAGDGRGEAGHGTYIPAKQRAQVQHASTQLAFLSAAISWAAHARRGQHLRLPPDPEDRAPPKLQWRRLAH